MLHPLLELVQCHWPPQRWQNEAVLVAVSGGADSMALLYGLHELGGRHLHVGHFNHGWRGAESDADATFVRQTAACLACPYHEGSAAATERSQGQSPAPDEASARRARLQFLTATAERTGCRYLAMAHTQDDHVETILQRIVRGTGLWGLCGIPAIRQQSQAVSVVRPLLHATRTNVLDYLASRQLNFRTDSSNSDRRYTRNRIRMELLPQLRRYNQRADEALLRLSQQACEAHHWIAQYANQWLSAAWHTHSPHHGQLDLTRVRQQVDQPDYLLRVGLSEIWRAHHWPLQAMTAAHWQDLSHWLWHGTDPARREFPGVSVERTSAWCYEFRSIAREAPLSAPDSLPAAPH